jgi:hypothetical protein
MRLKKVDKQLLKDVIEWDVVSWGRALTYWQEAGIDFNGCKRRMEI